MGERPSSTAIENRAIDDDRLKGSEVLALLAVERYGRDPAIPLARLAKAARVPVDELENCLRRLRKLRYL